MLYDGAAAHILVVRSPNPLPSLPLSCKLTRHCHFSAWPASFPCAFAFFTSRVYGGLSIASHIGWCLHRTAYSMLSVLPWALSPLPPSAEQSDATPDLAFRPGPLPLCPCASPPFLSCTTPLCSRFRSSKDQSIIAVPSEFMNTVLYRFIFSPSPFLVAGMAHANYARNSFHSSDTVDAHRGLDCRRLPRLPRHSCFLRPASPFPR